MLLGPLALGMAAMDAALAAGYRGESTFIGSWWLAAPVTLVVLSAAAAAATGGYAIVRRSEPALPVLLATWVASCMAVFVLGWGGVPL